MGVVFHRCLAATDVDRLWLEGLRLATHLEHDNLGPADNHVIDDEPPMLNLRSANSE